MKHLQQDIKQKMAIIPIALGATGVMTGAVIDRKGYAGVEFIVDYGSITTTGTDIAVLVKEGDATGSLTSVADGDLIGTEALASLAAGARAAGTGKEVSKRIGYKGNKRYVNLVLTHSGTTSVGCVAASAIMHTPEAAPVDNP